MAWRLLAMMLVGMAGAAVGANGVESLFFSRFGPDFLPVLYIALGPLTFLVMAGLSVPLSRGAARVLAALPLGLAAVLLLARAVLVLGIDAFYPVLWLVMMVVWTCQVMGGWGIAGAVSDTRQAKRLFPLYGAGLILGGVIGGLATGPLAHLLRTENLLMVWAAALVAAHLLARSLLRRSPAAPRRRGAPGVRLRSHLAGGMRDVWSSPLLRWMSVSLILFSVLYFTIALVFAEAATERFPRTEDLAGFLGLFMGASNGAALLTSLLVANRLFARFGLPAMVLALAAVYLAGFASLAVVGASFASLVAFRFAQMVWVNGVWATGWQALFNVVPEERRARVRSFMDGGPLQVGIMLAGALLLLADRVLAPSHLYVGGALAAALALWSMWRVRGAYGGALLDALRVGNPDVFRAEDEPFGGFREDAVARAALIEGAAGADPAVRRVSIEIVSETASPEVVPVLERATQDLDPEVRLAAVSGLGRAGDRGPTVRRLLTDPDPAVRSTAAGVLEGDPEALGVLEEMARDPRPEWRAAALPVLGGRSAAAGLEDPDPTVRRAAVAALGGSAAGRLVRALGDPDGGVRAAAASSLRASGSEGRAAVLRALRDPQLEAAALTALAGGSASPELAEYVHDRVREATRYHRLWLSIDPDEDERRELVAHALRHRALTSATNALRALAAEGDGSAMRVVLENLGSRDRQQRANALESLETGAERERLRPLIAVWDGARDRPAGSVDGLAELLGDPDPFLRAAAAFASGPSRATELAALRDSDPDPFVREAATATLGPMETLSTLSVLERVVFLRKVRMFADLPPADLKHIAEVATEHAFGDGDVIAEQDEPGDEMHIVVSGEIRVLSGGHRELARRQRGEYVGEMAIISEEPRMASLVCAGDVRTLSLDRRSFERIIRERPETSLQVMRVLCDRLRAAHADAGSA